MEIDEMKTKTERGRKKCPFCPSPSLDECDIIGQDLDGLSTGST